MQSTFERPTAQQVQSSWSKLISIWEVADEDTRVEIFRRIIQEIIVYEKSRVTVVLTAFPHFSRLKVRNNSRFGSGGPLRHNAPMILAAWLVRKYKLAKNGRHGLD